MPLQTSIKVFTILKYLLDVASIMGCKIDE